MRHTRCKGQLILLFFGALFVQEGVAVSFTDSAITTSADGADSVFAADLDGDGAMDVLSASYNDDKIAWYRNLGNGTFSEQQIITTSAHTAVSVFAADINGDGVLDVLSASSGDNKIAWYRNLGNATFSAQQIITTSAGGANSVFAADLDGDGALDVLSASYNDDKIAWYRNLGAGTFTTQRIITTATDTAVSVFAADLNGDGALDVLSASSKDDKIAWYRNLGNATFSAQRIITTSADGAHSVFAADLDGDGALDVLSASYNDGKIAWYRNLKNGTFSQQQIVSAHAAEAWSVFAADLNGDGALDVLSASSDNGKIAWYRNLRNGTFSEQQIITTFAYGARSVFAADLNGDGAVDVLSASSKEDKIAWYRNLGSWSISDEQIITTSAFGARSVFAADLNGDGVLDVLSASWGDDKIAWYRNFRNGTFGAQQIVTKSTDGAMSVFAADLDGDGALDVLSASYNDDKIAWYHNLGNGTFSSQHVIATSADGARSVFAADLDGDGALDVLSASVDDDKIAWYRNLGNGTFTTQRIITTSADGAWSVFAADLDGDGALDVLSASSNDDKIAWYRNLGAGTFTTQRIITIFSGLATFVFAADMDGDGALDVLSASNKDDKIAWYRNLGNATFSAQRIITTSADGAHSVFAADLDGDGALDVLSASYNDGKIAWYRNLGAGTFTAQQIIATTAHGAWSVFAADLNGDGALDVLSASTDDNKIAWYRNVFFPLPRPLQVTLSSDVVDEMCLHGPGCQLCGQFVSTLPSFYGRQGGLEVIRFSGTRLILSTPMEFDRAVGARRILLIFPKPGFIFDCSRVNPSAEACVIIRHSVVGSGTELVTYGGRVSIFSFGKLRGMLLDSCSDDTGLLFSTSQSSCDIFATGNNKTLNFPCSGLVAPSPGNSGFLISNITSSGLSFDSGFSHADGGGINIQNSSVVLTEFRCVNASALSGGCLAAVQSNVSLRRCVFSSNRAQLTGGGIVVQSSTVALSSCIMSSCAASVGGAIAIESGFATLSDTSLINNSASINGGAVSCVSSVEGYTLHRSFFTAFNSAFLRNSALSNGGAMYLASCLPDPSQFVQWMLSHSIVTNGAAERGGGIFYEGDSSLVCVNTTISKNSAFNGGGVYSSVVSSRGWVLPLNISGAITANVASSGGGGLFWHVPQNVPLSAARSFDTSIRALPIFENIAAQGPDFATNAIYVRIISNSISPPASQSSGSVILGELEFSLTDFYDQIITSESETQILLTSEATLQGNIQPVFANGIVNLTRQFSVTAAPGSSVNVSYLVTRNTSILVLPAPISVTLKACIPGEYESFGHICAPCPYASFSNASGVTACTACNAGFYQNLTGSSSCNSCPPGSASFLSGSLSCVSCPQGTFSPSAGSSLCTACAAGSYQNLTGSFSCVPCPPGSVSSSSGSASCASCFHGTVARYPNSTSCASCSVGSFQNVTGRSSCNLCLPGSASSLPGSVACTRCTEGTYAPVTNSSTCTACSAGSFQNTPGGSSCNLCPSGTFSTVGSNLCLPCSKNQFSLQGASACQSCGPGTFSDIGSSACSQCAAGSYNDKNESDCKACPEGQATAYHGSTTCARCLPNTFARFQGMSACSPCISGSYSPTGSSTCTFCGDSQYVAYRSDGGTCALCLAGATCNEGIMTPRAGYWMSAIENFTVVSVHPCPPGLCEGPTSCGEGRDPPSVNPLCGKCKQGYSEWSGRCVDCHDAPNYGPILLQLTLAFGLVTFLYITSRETLPDNDIPHDQQHAHRVGIFLYFLQTATLLVSGTASFAFWFDVANLNVIGTVSGSSSGGCVWAIPQELSIFVPILSQIFLLFVAAGPFTARWLYIVNYPLPSIQEDNKHWFIKTKFAEFLRFNQNNAWDSQAFLRCALAVFLYSFYSVVVACLRGLKEVRLLSLDGHSELCVLANYPSMECNHKWTVAFVLVLLLELLIPLGILVVLLRDSAEVAFKHRVLSLLLLPYKDLYYLWELWGIYIRRVALLAVAVFAPTVSLRLSMYVFLIAVHLCVHVAARPYNDQVDNALETFSLVGLIAISCVMISALTADPSIQSLGQDVLVPFFFFGLILLFFTFSKLILPIKSFKTVNRHLQRVRTYVLEDLFANFRTLVKNLVRCNCPCASEEVQHPMRIEGGSLCNSTANIRNSIPNCKSIFLELCAFSIFVIGGCICSVLCVFLLPIAGICKLCCRSEQSGPPSQVILDRRLPIHASQDIELS